MTYQELSTLALKLTGESSTSTATDYLSRTPSLLVPVIARCIDVDNAYRAARGTPAITWTVPATVSLSERCPLSDVFLLPAAFELASLLALNEDAQLSQTLHERFEEGIRSLPMCSSETEQAYPRLLQ